MTYEITTFDVCMSGMERLRNRDEFILLASVWHGMGKTDLRSQFIDDIQAVAREDDFDYEGCRNVVNAFMETTSMQQVLEFVSEPDYDENGEPIEDDSESCQAFLYIRRV